MIGKKYQKLPGKSSAFKGAQLMVELGFDVFPLRPNSKEPYERDTCLAHETPLSGGIHAATKDQAAIASWFDIEPNINFGVSTTGSCVIDIDVKKGKKGKEEFGALGKLPDTLRVHTPSGGFHAYFSDADCGQRKLSDGLDVRSRGGYVVGPGSVVDGKAYAVVNDVPIAPLPESLVERVQRAPIENAVAKRPLCELDTDQNIALGKTYLKGQDGVVEGQGADGGRDNTAYRHACRLKDFGLSPELIVELFEECWNSKNSPPLAKSALVRVARSAYSNGQSAPGSSNPALEFEDVGQLSLSGAAQNTGLSYEAVCLDDVEEKPIEWLWSERLALGKIVSLSGEPKRGKSQISCAFAAATTTGEGWPDGFKSDPGSVILVTCEDDDSDTIKPRMLAAGANPNKIHLYKWTVDKSEKGRATRKHFDVGKHIDNLKKIVTDIGDVRLIIIDPISAYLGKADGHKTGDVRGALGPLQTLAAEFRIAVLLIMHLNKNTNEKSALNRVGMSGAFTAVSRGNYIVVTNPLDPSGEESLLLPIGANIGKHNKTGFSYRIEGVQRPGGVETSKVVFNKDPVRMSADEALNPPENRSNRAPALMEACEFLSEILAEGPVDQMQIAEAADGQGISHATLRRAKKHLNLEKQRTKGETPRWQWRLPDDWRSDEPLDASEEPKF